MRDGGGKTAPLAAPLAKGPEPTEIIHVDDLVVACDGGVGALGHPRVWLRIVPVAGQETAAPQIMCPYCSRLYVLNDGAGHDSGH